MRLVVALLAVLTMGGCNRPERCDYVGTARSEVARQSWKLDATQRPVVEQRASSVVVSWTLPPDADKGGTPVIDIRSSDCRVVSAIHEK